MLDRLNEALERVERNLDEPVDVAAMARTVLVSEHHFRRMFSVLAGMPISEYARRRRLTLAGAEVLRGEATLLDIAVRYGYGSAEAFARAFRAMHGVGPGQARREGAALDSQSRLTFHLTVEGNTIMRYRIVEKEAFRLTGPGARVPIVCEGENETMTAFVKGIDDATWRRIDALSDQEPRGILGVTSKVKVAGGEAEETDFLQAAATSSDEVPEGMESLEIPAGTWAVFPFERYSFPEEIQRIWAYAFGEWFPSNPAYLHAEGPDMLRVEYEGHEEGLASGELWMPVRRTA